MKCECLDACDRTLLISRWVCWVCEGTKLFTVRVHISASGWPSALSAEISLSILIEESEHDKHKYTCTFVLPLICARILHKYISTLNSQPAFSHYNVAMQGLHHFVFLITWNFPFANSCGIHQVLVASELHLWLSTALDCLSAQVTFFFF